MEWTYLTLSRSWVEKVQKKLSWAMALCCKQNTKARKKKRKKGKLPSLMVV